jgi:hypothetical protein
MHNLPNDIQIGMKVYDSRRKHIGNVDDFRAPENATNPEIEPADIDATDKAGRQSVVDIVANAFDDDPIPEVLRDRLLTEGYVRLDADGVFAADRYILPEQIASASGDEIVLNVEKAALIKRH